MATVNRRESILEAAKLEFASEGYAGGRIERIAAAAKVNKQLIFHYFRSKDGLYSAVVVEAVSRFRMPVGLATSPPDALRAAISSIVRSLDSDDMLVAAAVDCATRGGVPTLARSAMADWESRLRMMVGDLVADGQRQGFFRDDIWPATIAEYVVNECLGRSIRVIISSDANLSRDQEPSNNVTAAGAWVVDYCAWR